MNRFGFAVVDSPVLNPRNFMVSSQEPSRSTLWLAIAAISSIGATLAPWLHNRGYLNDILDYGLMIAANARIAVGDRPFVDFATPLQSGSFWINYQAERWLGGTYQAMTLGNGIAILLTLALLAAVLRTRTSALTALGLASVLVVGTLGQHTIIWYNGIGAIVIAIVSWGTAIAPVLRRSTWGWHMLVTLGLFIGGTIKLNFQLVALASAIGWALRAAVVKGESWPKVILTILLWLVAGLVAPILAELAWTGATWTEWRHYVIDLALSARGDTMSSLLSWDFYLKPMHNYYGWVLGPTGALVALWLLVTIGLAWKGRNGADRFFLIAASFVALGGMAGLIATNFEIVYVSLSAAMAMIIALWIGYDLLAHPWLRRSLLLAPMLGLGTLMWWAAWQGQRALFGHATDDRADYRELQSQHGEFAYLRGTRIPPGLADSYEQLAKDIPVLPAGEKYPYFYSTGAEWLDRVWPAITLPHLPILKTDVNIGEAEVTQLRNAFSRPPKYTKAIGLVAWGPWPGGLTNFMSSRSFTGLVGQLTVSEVHGGLLTDRLDPRDSALSVLINYGGNVDAEYIRVLEPLWSRNMHNGRPFIGAEGGRGIFRFELPSYRMAGQVVITRTNENLADAVPATFTIREVMPGQTTPGTGNIIWSETVTLATGETEATASYSVDTRGQSTDFIVEVAPVNAGKITAGWMLPSIHHAGPASDEAPFLRYPRLEPEPVDQTWREAMLPAGWTDDFDVVVRHGQLVDGTVVVARGGEVWFRPRRPIQDFHTRLISVAPAHESDQPIARVVWYKGGRVEIQNQVGVPPGEKGSTFKSWPAEGDGWFGVLVDPSYNPNGVRVKVETINAAP